MLEKKKKKQALVKCFASSHQLLPVNIAVVCVQRQDMEVSSSPAITVSLCRAELCPPVIALQVILGMCACVCVLCNQGPNNY